MNRRNFLKLTATYTGGLLVLPHFLSASSLFRGKNETDNVLVFIQLNGGNDSLNTFIPFENPLYYELRKTIGIAADKVINKANGLGFHPALKDFAQISQEGNLSIIQNVGYANPNRSHFRSQEIWQTASDSNQYLNKGWLGRFMDIQCKDENLAAINLDSIDNLALKAENINSLTLKEPNRLGKMAELEEGDLKFSNNPQLDFVRKIAYSSSEGMAEIQKALKNAKNTPDYANNPLAKNLQWISKLIKGKLESKVYYTSLGGFDTHNNQISLHNRQLTIVNDAVFSFYQDLKAENLLDRVTLVIFSEFGRRVKENGTGTDHGTAGAMVLIGGKNKGKIIGENPDLANLDNGDLIYKIDFRSVYGSILKNKFGFEPSQIGISQKIVENLW